MDRESATVKTTGVFGKRGEGDGKARRKKYPNGEGKKKRVRLKKKKNGKVVHAPQNDRPEWKGYQEEGTSTRRNKTPVWARKKE